MPGPYSRWPSSPEKRTVDIVGAGAALFVTAPIIAFAALTTYALDRKNPFFAQQRVGLDGNLFTTYKLRTLKGEGDLGGPGQGVADPRATRHGRLFRQLAIDELPQLWNILRGDMSLVGPRPLTKYDEEVVVNKLEKPTSDIWLHARALTKSGLVCAFAIESRSIAAQERESKEFSLRRAELDINYAAEAVPTTDIKLCYSALKAALSRPAEHE